MSISDFDFQKASSWELVVKDEEGRSITMYGQLTFLNKPIEIIVTAPEFAPYESIHRLPYDAENKRPGVTLFLPNAQFTMQYDEPTETSVNSRLDASRTSQTDD